MDDRSSGEGAVKELRLGLVCYGGVSLAIYMHGITKELHKLVIASRAYESGSSENPFDGHRTEHAYFELLKTIEDQTKIRWRVVIDVISGTSAGGINGIYLAKALAHDLTQDGLRDLWMDKGDIKKLLRGPSWMPKLPRAAIALGGALRHKGQGEPPLRGDLMCKWLFQALEGMKPRKSDSATLVDKGSSLELFVTLTDFSGYPRFIPIKGLTVRDKRHRHVLAFTFDESMRQDQFDARYDRMLAFGARGTSCFPGAFAPISLDDFDVYVGGSGDPKISNEFFRLYELAGAPANKTYFVDGGVLDNFPFGHTIQAIHRKPASTQVVRRLVYIEPDPNLSKAQAGPHDQPGWLSTIWGGLSKIPLHEPILDDLVRIRERNEKVDRVRDVIRSNEEKVAAALSFIDGLPQKPDQKDIGEWNKKVHEKAADLTGGGYDAYLHIKAVSVVRAFADTLNCVMDFPKESNEAVLVRRATAAWAREEKIIGETGVSAADRDAFLRCFDLPYAARRLRFIIDGVNEMYRDVGTNASLRMALDDAKSSLYDLRAKFTSVLAGRDFPDALVTETKSALKQKEVSRLAREDEGPKAYMESQGARFRELKSSYEQFYNESFKGFGTELYTEFQRITEGWEPEIRRKLIIRYLGFPIWDALIFPLIEVGDLGEIDALRVVRFSPDLADKLSKKGAKGKLVGVGLHHFKAFFDRLGREKDYTWGRLDGAESIIKLLTDEAEVVATADKFYSDAFEAVFEEEKELEGARNLHGELGEKIGSPAPTAL